MMEGFTITDLEKEIQEIRARNGWEIRMACRGIWEFDLLDKETGSLIAETGATSMAALLNFMLDTEKKLKEDR